jgi:uncharacterized protein (DUF2235 family)
VKNIVVCFDSARAHPGSRNATNAEALLGLLDESDDQVTWYHPGARSSNPRRLGGLRRRHARDEARAAITEAYEFLIDCWQPEDRIYLFGVGRGAYCARSLTRLLGTVGLFPQLMDYLLDAYALPRTRRTPQDWTRVRRLAARLAGRRDIGVPVHYLGLWDTLKLPGLPQETEPLANVDAGRHAVAIDGGYGPFGEHLVTSGSDRVEEVWFRGAHCDVAGTPAACQPLTQITLDWVLDGAMRAGVVLRPGSRYLGPAPSEFDALAGSARTISIRKLPANALVHASVNIYLRAHPEYWRRLPAHVIWADMDWLARSERLVHAEPTTARVVPEVLAAAAS